MACNGMASSSSFPSNFMMQTHCGEENQLGIPVSPLLLANLQDLGGESFPGIETRDEMTADDDLSDDGLPAGEKKKRLNIEQVRTLERNFELGNRLEPERKMQLARVLGLRPRQVAIWFQNRRARWKTKQLEKEYDVLKRQLEATKTENEALQVQNKKLQAEVSLSSMKISSSF
ncbi:hypothetical protein BHE74_00049575 [Ensete ventricosum]|nr:hypothetical protein GW17_00018978 [Ensete ventricosum]RWW44648.1 hypothetical protein BHE74_00049575 [Ensete ventricosum]RZR87529.1 hypothetical protein BHM03_00014952 [Ensete ventricosum]